MHKYSNGDKCHDRFHNYGGSYCDNHYEIHNKITIPLQLLVTKIETRKYKYVSHDSSSSTE